MNRAIAIALACWSTSIAAFSLDGFATAMTLESVKTVMSQRGYDLRQTFHVGNEEDWVAIRPPSGTDIGDAGPSFAFCQGRLVSYSHMLDFDAEYVPTLDSLLAVFGQPRTVSTKREPWTGPHGGYVASVEMNFYKGDERASITFFPEGRTGSGELRHFRGGSVSYSSRNSCWRQW